MKTLKIGGLYEMLNLNPSASVGGDVVFAEEAVMENGVGASSSAATAGAATATTAASASVVPMTMDHDIWKTVVVYRKRSLKLDEVRELGTVFMVVSSFPPLFPQKG